MMKTLSSRTVAAAVAGLLGAIAAELACLWLFRQQLMNTAPINKWMALGSMLFGALGLGALGYAISGSQVRRQATAGRALLILICASGIVATALIGNWSVPVVMAKGVGDQLAKVPTLKDVTSRDYNPYMGVTLDARGGFPMLKTLAETGIKMRSAFFADVDEGSGPRPPYAVVPTAEEYGFVEYLQGVEPFLKAKGFEMTPNAGGDIRLVVKKREMAEGESLKGKVQKQAERLKRLYRDNVEAEYGSPKGAASEEEKSRRPLWVRRFIDEYIHLAESIQIMAEPSEETSKTIQALNQWIESLDDLRRPLLMDADIKERGLKFTQTSASMKLAAEKEWARGGTVLADVAKITETTPWGSIAAAQLDKRLTTDMVAYYAFVAREAGYWKTDLKPAFSTLLKRLDELAKPKSPETPASTDAAKPAEKRPEPEPLAALRRLGESLRKAIETDVNKGQIPTVDQEAWEPISLLATIRDYLEMESWGNPKISIPNVGERGMNDAIETEWTATFVVGYPNASVNPRKNSREEAVRVAFAIVAKYLRIPFAGLLAHWTDRARKFDEMVKSGQVSAASSHFTPDSKPVPHIRQPWKWDDYWKPRPAEAKEHIRLAGFEASHTDDDPTTPTQYLIMATEQRQEMERYLVILRQVVHETENLLAGGLGEVQKGGHWYALFDVGGKGEGINPFDILFKIASGLPVEMPPKDPSGRRNWAATKPETPREGKLLDTSGKAILEVVVQAERRTPKLETNLAETSSTTESTGGDPGKK